MTVLPILLYPDQRLRQPCAEITHWDDPACQHMVDDLVATMQAHPGCVGLAAPQVDRPWQLLVIHCGLGRKPADNHHGLLVVGNPVILSWSGMEAAREGCLSLPDYTGNVVRATEIQVRFHDRLGHLVTLTLTDYEARVMQHEMDHLEGRLFVDRVVSRKADLFQRKKYMPQPDRLFSR